MTRCSTIRLFPTALVAVIVAFMAQLAVNPAIVSAQVVPGVDPGGAPVQAWSLSPAGRGGSASSDRPNLTYSVAPGTTIEDSIIVSNLGTTQLTIELYAADARNTADGGFDLLPSGVPSVDVGTWVRFPQAAVTLAPGTQITVPITIEVPPDANPGDHIGGVLASVKVRSNAPDGTDVAVDRRTGTRIYLRVEGPITPQLSITSVSSSYDPKPNPVSGTQNVAFTIRNTGNVRMSGTYYVSVSGPFGMGERATVPASFTELVPGQALDLTASLDDIPALGLATATVHLTSSPTTGEAGSEVTDSRSALALAIPILLVGLVVIAVLGFVAWAAYQRRRRNEITMGATA